eukprot:1680481-Pyramimonas_sp.AAC.1
MSCVASSFDWPHRPTSESLWSFPPEAPLASSKGTEAERTPSTGCMQSITRSSSARQLERNSRPRRPTAPAADGRQR